MKFLRFFAFFLLFCGIFCICFYFHFGSKKPSVLSVQYSDKTFLIKFRDVYAKTYCAVSTSRKDIKWSLVREDVCKVKINDFGNYKIFIKFRDEVYVDDKVNQVYDFSLRNKKTYLAVGDSRELLYDVVSIGDALPVFDVSDSSVVKVSGDKIIAKGVGKVSVGFFDKSFDVVVTDLIDKRPRKYNYTRPYLSCLSFSNDEAKLLDEILFSRIKDAGYGTRAGVVEAARFLTLEFPYRISYFSENGRLSSGNGIDGEGRFYHKGLYLSRDKFSVISRSDKGPNPWGCMIYSRPSKGMRANGLDCSGFTTWALYNGGFDVGDLGARGIHPSYDLNSFGEEVRLTRDISFSDKIKAGDLLGEVTSSEGHSAMVVGVDKNNYYVAESLWISPLGLNVNTYSRDELYKNFETVNLMDSYYKKDGNYTSMW